MKLSVKVKNTGGDDYGYIAEITWFILCINDVETDFIFSMSAGDSNGFNQKEWDEQVAACKSRLELQIQEAIKSEPQV